MKQRTTRRNDSLQFLTKPYYNCIYLLSIACILNGLILEAYAKAPLHISGWQFPSQFDQELNNAWTITNPPISSKTQLTLKIEPPFQNHIYVYGVEKGNVGNNKTQALFSGSTGYVGIDGYQDGSLICFVVLRNSLAGDEISWYDHCHELDKDEESQEQLNIDLNSLTNVTTISPRIFSSLGRPSLELGNGQFKIRLTSPTDLGKVHFSYVDQQPQIFATFFPSSNSNDDEVNRFKIRSNRHLRGYMTAAINKYLESNETPFLVGNETVNVSLNIDCKITLQDPHLGDIKSWTEYLGWSVMIPSTVQQAESQNWRKSKVDQICDDDKDMPGFRYENLNEPSKFGLMLIFDVQNYLTGIQVAIPKDLVDENGIYDYETSPYYYNRFYNGEPAYVISLYLDDREDVCRLKTEEELLCDPSLRQKALLLTKTSEIPIYKTEANALENGWRIQRRSKYLGHLLSPYDYDHNKHAKDLAPYLASYKEGQLTGLSLIHFVENSLSPQFNDSSSFEMSNPSDLFINPPETLNTSFYNMKALRSNFYIGSKVARDFAHTDDSFFYIEVKDDEGQTVEGAVIQLKSSEDEVRAAQLSTDRHGKAFIVFDEDVYDIDFELEMPSNQKISDGRIWKPKPHYQLHRSHQTQTVIVESITKASVHVDASDLSYDDLQFEIWTDKSHGKAWKKAMKQHHMIETFHVDLDVSEIHILGHHHNMAILTYHVLKIDNNREVKNGLHGLNIHTKIESHKKKSTINVKEVQSDHVLMGAQITVEIGLAQLHARTFKFDIREKTKDSLYLDVPSGILISWHIHGPKNQWHQPFPDVDSSITPFKKTAKLLKTVDIGVHVCLLSKNGDNDENGSEKESVVEAILEYEWASQEDRHEIVPVDYKGDIKLDKVASPSPGERLNVTLISRLGSPQIFFDGQESFHRPLTEHFSEIRHEDNGPIHLRLCHRQEMVVVVVSNGVTHWKMDGVNVQLRTENHDSLKQITTEDGAAFFSFHGGDVHEGHKFFINVETEHYDAVQITRHFQQSEKTQIIHVDLFPHQRVRLHVHLGNEGHYRPLPAFGAIVDWTSDDEGGIVGVTGNGIAELELSGKSDTIHAMTISIPWQTTCGNTKHGDVVQPIAKEVYGSIKMQNRKYPLHHRRQPPFEIDEHINLPKLTSIQYELQLHGLFPDIVELHTNILLQQHENNDDDRTAAKKSTKIEDPVVHQDKVKFQLDIGATQAFLLLEEFYSSKIVVTPLDPCFTIDSDLQQSEDENSIKIDHHSVYHDTVRVKIKMVNKHMKPFTNATLNYVLGETAFGHRSMHPNHEDGDIEFHLPEDMLVHIATETLGPANGNHRGRPDPDNPTYFVAKDGLVLHLMFGGGSRYLPVTAKLRGDGFEISEGSLVRYVMKDWAGDEEIRGVQLTNYEGVINLDMTIDTAFIDFTIGGSDGFEPLFYQPFEYVYNVSDDSMMSNEKPMSNNNNWHIEIPVKSVKNVIVSVKDCFTGEIIDVDTLVEFPTDSYVPNSWYDSSLMPNRYSAYTDKQGMAFFLLEPDLMVPVKVSADGYENYASSISIASNITYLVEANLCKLIKINIKVVDKDRHNHPVINAKISISIDNHKEFDVITNDKGEAIFDATTSMKNLSLQIVDADDSIQNPMFELQDEQYFLKEGNVHIKILEREYTIHLETASCTRFRQYSDIPVQVKIDNATEFIKTSDKHGSIQFRVPQSAKEITAIVIQPTDSEIDQFHSEDNHHSIGLIPVNELPARFRFKLISSPVLLRIKLQDEYNGNKAVPHATVGVSLGDQADDKFLEIVTDRDGHASLKISHTPKIKTITLQVLDASEDVIEPKFEIYDDCSDFMDSNDIKIETLERMYTINVATANCHDYHHVNRVPILVNIGYHDQKQNHKHINIHEEASRQNKIILVDISNAGYDHRQHLTEYVLTSGLDGEVKLRIHESAANVTLTVLSPPPPPMKKLTNKGHEDDALVDVVNLGLLVQDEIPDRFDFVFFALPKDVTILVKDAQDDRSVPEAEVKIKYYDRATDSHVMKTDMTDHFGKALFRVDGCVEFASFTVLPPSSRECDDGKTSYQVEKRQHWNIFRDQKFKISLKPSKSQHRPKSREITIRSKLKNVNVMKYSLQDQRHATEMDGPDPFFHHWYLKTKTNDKTVNLLTISNTEHIMGLTTAGLVSHHGHAYIDTFENSVQVQLKVENEHGHSLEYAHIFWQVGFNLGKAKIQTDSHGKAHVYAPPGHLLALEADAHGCRSRLTVDEVKDEGQKIILICKD